jgi:ornithine cyclodeaminase
MRLISDAEVVQLIDMQEAIKEMTTAFEQFGRGAGAVTPRVRAGAEYNKQTAAIAAMGAALPASDVVGAKVYSTVDGRFNFVIVLFSARTGDALCAIAANEITRFRTAAASAVAMRALARRDAKTLSIFGAGVQASAHAEAFLLSHPFEKIYVAGRSKTAAFAEQIQSRFGVPSFATDINTAASEGDVIVTCTRAANPLFDGGIVQPGAFIAAVGSSKPQSRELDDKLLARAEKIVVEWLPAAKAEAGEFVRAADGVIDPAHVFELGNLLVNEKINIRHPEDIVIYKSVGIGLEDIALANLVWKRVQ